MKGQVRPFGPDYLILDAVDKALETAAYHFTREPSFYFTREPSFYATKPRQSNWRPPGIEGTRHEAGD
jgi:hypothetical protein